MEIIFVLIYSIFLIGTIIVPINDIKSNFLYRGILGIIITFGLNIIISIITYMIGMKCSTELLSAVYLFLFIPIIYRVLKEKRIQKLYISLKDMIFGIACGMIIIIIMMKQYGMPLNIKYETTDASTHFLAAVSFKNHQTLLLKEDSKLNEEFGFQKLMFGSYVNTGIFISIFSGFLDEMELYQLYIIFDMIILWLSIFLFYMTLSHSSMLKRKIVIWMVSFMYILSYPLNSVLMGSAYLTLSLLLVTTILLVLINREKIKPSLFYSVLFVLNMALIHTYMLFAIIVLISEIIYIAFKLKKIKPCMIVLLPVFSLILYTNNVSEKLLMIQEEGPMYKNYYSNFIIFVPFILTKFYQEIKEKKFFNIENVFILVNFVTIVCTYLLKQKGLISSYYCLKYYYILWVFTMFIVGKMLLKLSSYKASLGILFAILVLITISISNLDYTYSEEELLKDITKESIFSIGDGFYHNINIILNHKCILNQQELETIRKVKEMGIDEFCILGGDGQTRWVCAILDKFIESNIDVENLEYEYLLGFKRATYLHQNIEKLKEKYEFMDENKYGGILRYSIPLLELDDGLMEKSKTLNGKEASYCNPIIPKGFKASEDGASWKYKANKVEGWNEGLVIEDAIGNQFVWVPVKDGIGKDGKYVNENEVRYQKWYMNEKKDRLEEKTKRELEKILGKDNLGDFITEEQIVEDKLSNGVTNEQEQILKYGGFYIARYESGIGKNVLQKMYSLEEDYQEITVDERNNTMAYKPVSKENAQIWNFIEYSNAKIVAENMYHSEDVKSGLMTGRQFDTIMRWAVSNEYNLNDATTWGNFFDTYSNDYRYSYASYLRKKSQDWKLKGYGKKDSNNMIFTSSGGLEIASMNHIYDIAGNVFEFTTDLYEGKISLVRGGCAAYSGKESSPHPVIAGSMGDSLHYVIGFRVVLYIS